MDSALRKLQEKLSNLDKVSERERQELGNLVEQLQQELNELAVNDHDKAVEIGSAVQDTASQALHGGTAEAQLAADDFTSIIEKLEISHPRLTDVVNRMCKVLADIGI